MAGEFTSSYQRTTYWLDLLWPDRETKRRTQEQEDSSPRLDEADFEDGYRYEETEHGTFRVQQYPTGRWIGEIRQTEDGTWQARHRPDADWEDADYQRETPGGATEGQDENYDKLTAQRRRTAAAAYLEQRHCGELEGRLLHRGIYVDYDADYSLDTLHNAQNALDQGVERQQVDAYMRHHTSPEAEPNEHTVTVEVVPGSTHWNTADADTRRKIMTTSPWAVQRDQSQQAPPQAQRQQTVTRQQVALEQLRQQAAAAQPEPSSHEVAR